MHRKAFLALAVVCCLSGSAFAATEIYIGDYEFFPDTTNNVVEILVTGAADNKFEGVDLAMFVSADGGASSGGPIITSVKLNQDSDLLLFGVSNPQENFFAIPGVEVFSSTLTTVPGTVVGPTGILARLEFSTVGIPVGVYDVYLDWFGELTALAGLQGADRTITYRNGTIEVKVPEPSSIVLGGIAALGMCVVAVRRRRKAA